MKTRLVLLGLLCLGIGQAVLAQSITVKVPFAFAISDRVYPAGQYSLSSSRDKLIVQDSAGKTISMAFSNAVAGRQVGVRGEIVFHCYANRCFLSEFWTPTSDVGRQLQRSRSEIESAQSSTETYFALMGTLPERNVKAGYCQKGGHLLRCEL